eukprot:GHVN01094791.1.p1 GENE.GHVN01094791.1~~GHVN01094791.1.p1  ORF type:complete len:102 (-),score=0.38 GHVN01094791.1:785-1090(-)
MVPPAPPLFPSPKGATALKSKCWVIQSTEAICVDTEEKNCKFNSCVIDIFKWFQSNSKPANLQAVIAPNCLCQVLTMESKLSQCLFLVDWSSRVCSLVALG